MQWPLYLSPCLDPDWFLLRGSTIPKRRVWQQSPGGLSRKPFLPFVL